MFEEEKYGFETILNHILICEKRFAQISKPEDFISSDDGGIILDAIVTRLQAIAENVKRIAKHNPVITATYSEIEWEKIIRFRDFISHHYELLDYEVVFDICKTNLPQLKKVVIHKLSHY